MNTRFNLSTLNIKTFFADPDPETGELPELGYNWKNDPKVNPEMEGYVPFYDPFNLETHPFYDPY